MSIEPGELEQNDGGKAGELGQDDEGKVGGTGQSDEDMKGSFVWLAFLIAGSIAAYCFAFRSYFVFNISATLFTLYAVRKIRANVSTVCRIKDAIDADSAHTMGSKYHWPRNLLICAVILYGLGVYICIGLQGEAYSVPILDWSMGAATTVVSKLADLLIVIVGFKFIGIDKLLIKNMEQKKGEFVAGHKFNELLSNTQYTLDHVNQPTVICLMILFVVSLVLILSGHGISSAFSSGGSLAVMSFSNIIAIRFQG